MLIKAQYEGDKLKVLHANPIGPMLKYNKELRKDPSNGWTKERTMRHIARVDMLTLKAYEQAHPGWKERMAGSANLKDQKKAWFEFMTSPWGYGVMVVDQLKHG